MAERIFPNWLKAYMEYTSHSESPDAFHFWTGVSVIAGALRRQVWIEQHYFQWTPNFYIILVGPPGVAAKSTSVGIGHALLTEIKDIMFGPVSMTWQGLTKALSEAKRLVAYGEEFLPMSCITCSVSELGTFLRPKESDMVDVLTDLWDGKLSVWKRRLKSEETNIENPWINVIGCTTPAWLRENFPEHLVGGGLTSRIVFVYGDTKRRLIAYPSKDINEEAFKEMGVKLISDLTTIAELKGPYTITPEAMAWGEAWYARHWSQRDIAMASERFDGYIARKQGHMHKIAIILAAAQRNQLVIERSDLEAADRFLTALEVDMRKVFQSIGVSDTARPTMELLALIRAHGKIKKLDLWRLCIASMDSKVFSEAIDSLVRANYIRLMQVDNEVYIYAEQTSSPTSKIA